MDYVTVSDVARYYAVIAASLLIVMFLRLGLARARAQGWGRGDHPHPLTSLGISVVLVNIARRRFDSLGEPGDAYLWSAVVGLSAIGVGLALTLRWSFTHHRET